MSDEHRAQADVAENLREALQGEGALVLAVVFRPALCRLGDAAVQGLDQVVWTSIVEDCDYVNRGRTVHVVREGDGELDARKDLF